MENKLNKEQLEEIRFEIRRLQDKNFQQISCSYVSGYNEALKDIAKLIGLSVDCNLIWLEEKNA